MPGSMDFPTLDPATPPTVTAPIDATSSELTVTVKNLILQFVGLAGVLITLFGVSESSWIVHLYRFAQSSAAVPIIGFAAGIGASGWQIIRIRRKQRELQTVTLLPTTPDTVAIGPQNPSVAVQKAVGEAAERVDAAAPAIISTLMGQKL